MRRGAPVRRTVQAREINCPDCGARAGQGCVQKSGSVYYRTQVLCPTRIAAAARVSNGGRAALRLVGGEVVGAQLEIPF